jgi:N-dimethylarginine dimethylaminohydrolase
MTKTLLMCAPDYFDIEYEINPWMHLDDQVDPKRARHQWEQLHRTYVDRLGWKVELIAPVEHLPDMVFTANGGLVIDGKVALPRFRQPEREGETPYFQSWFRAYDLTMFQPKHDFEGEGDALVWRDFIFAGFPWRSDRPVHREIGEYFGRRVVSLQLTDARFYHLDTALTIVDDDTVALYPRAFTAQSLAALASVVPHIIEATDRDAMAYGLNAISDGTNIVLSDGAVDLHDVYRKRGMNVCPTPISEFQKSGGGVKCLTLELRGRP